MSARSSYKIGRGKPPVPARFKKGPFRLAMDEALAETVVALSRTQARTTLESAAHKLVLEAANGSTTALRLLHSLLDGSDSPATVRRMRAAQHAKAEQEVDETPTFSLHQGNEQGIYEKSLSEILKAQAANRLANDAICEAAKRRIAAAKASGIES